MYISYVYIIYSYCTCISMLEVVIKGLTYCSDNNELLLSTKYSK